MSEFDFESIKNKAIERYCFKKCVSKGTGEKIMAELALADKIRAVDTDDLAERILNSHLMPDMIGNLRSFSKQSFRCPKTNRCWPYGFTSLPF